MLNKIRKKSGDGDAVPAAPKTPRRAWDDTEVPPLWIWLVGSVAVVGIAFLIIWKISDSMSEARALTSAPAPSQTATAGGSRGD